MGAEGESAPLIFVADHSAAEANATDDEDKATSAEPDSADNYSQRLHANPTTDSLDRSMPTMDLAHIFGARLCP